jgi:hypothetical protein
MNRTMTLVIPLALLATACASTSLPPHSEFEDVPVPRGMVFRSDDSTVIESPNVKAARLVYRGRLEPDSLRRAMRTMLEGGGWQHLSTTTRSDNGTVQAFEKNGNALTVNIHEGVWYTYMAVEASRALTPATASTSPSGSAPPTASAPPAASPLSTPTTIPAPPPSVEARASTDSAPAGAPPPEKPRSTWESVKSFFSGLFGD